MKTVTFPLSLLALVLTSCAAKETPATAAEEPKTLVGTWTQPVPGMPELRQGFELSADGKATSIGMATLKYERWEQNADTLIISGQSIGNGQTIDFADTLRICQQEADSLVLLKGEMEMVYHRD